MSNNVLRSTTFQLEFNGNDGLTGVRTFTKAVRDADAVVEELSKSMGENATVTVKNTKTKQDFVRESRATATQMAKSQNQAAKLTSQYKLMTSSIGKTSESVELMTAMQKLGSNATLKQRQEVAAAISEYHKLNNSVNGTQGSLRNFRGVMQNAGWQIQDTVVQLQMGTSAFTVLSQQGSQMASAFGPKGAIVGAFIAVAGVIGGTLFKSLQSATQKTKEFDAANKAVNEYIKINSEGLTELSSKYEELARVSEVVARSQLAMTRNDAMTAQLESTKLVKEQVDDLNGALAMSILRSKDFNTETGKSTGDFLQGFGRLETKTLDNMTSSFKRLNDDVTPENIENFLTYLNDIKPSGKEATKELNEIRKGLVDQFVAMTHNRQILKDTEDGWKSLSGEQSKTSSDIIKAFENEAQASKKQTETIEAEFQRRKKLILDAVATGEETDEDPVAAMQRVIDWRAKAIKEAAEKAYANDPIVQAFNKEIQSLTKQTQSVEEEYVARKKVLDDYVAKYGGSNEEIKKGYAELEQWKTEQLDSEYQKFSRSLNNQTRTTEDEYNRRKTLIDNHVKLVGFIDEQAAQDYVELESWKTEQLKTEYDKRERVRKQIENAQISARATTDPVGAENDKYIANIKTLTDQRTALGEEQLSEKQRIDKLIEAEHKRHLDALKDAELQQYQNQISTVSMVAQQMTSLADIMANGTQSVKEQTAEMNDFQKTMFVTSQIIAAAQAVVDGMSLGMQLAEMFPLAAVPMQAFGTGLGAATAGAIMGTTIAGAFDNGGYIPSGQVGAVAGFGDEFVNGTLIQGPANVTSRKDTAELLRDGGGGGTVVGLNLSIQNEIKGAQYEVQQLSETEVRVIAKQVFDQNIDSGVSNTLSNSNSKSAKTMRQSYSVRRNL